MEELFWYLLFFLDLEFRTLNLNKYNNFTCWVNLNLFD